MADNYTGEEWQKQMVKYTGEQLVAHLDWMGVDWVKPDQTEDKKVRVLDYACGPGPVSAVRCSSITYLQALPCLPLLTWTPGTRPLRNRNSRCRHLPQNGLNLQLPLLLLILHHSHLRRRGRPDLPLPTITIPRRSHLQHLLLRLRHRRLRLPPLPLPTTRSRASS